MPICHTAPKGERQLMGTFTPQMPFSIPCRCYNPRCSYTWVQRNLAPPRKCPLCQSRHWYDPTWFNRKPQPAQLEITIPPETDPGPLPEGGQG